MDSMLGRLVAAAAWAVLAVFTALPVNARAVAKVAGAPYASRSSQTSAYYNASGMEF